MALIQLQGAVSDIAKITSEPSKLRQGEDIIVFGFPLNSVLSSGGNLTPGVVSASTGLENNTNQIQITERVNDFATPCFINLLRKRVFFQGGGFPLMVD